MTVGGVIWLVFLCVYAVPTYLFARYLLKGEQPMPFEDTNLGARLASKNELRKAGVIRRPFLD